MIYSWLLFYLSHDLSALWKLLTTFTRIWRQEASKMIKFMQVWWKLALRTEERPQWKRPRRDRQADAHVCCGSTWLSGAHARCAEPVSACLAAGRPQHAVSVTWRMCHKTCRGSWCRSGERKGKQSTNPWQTGLRKFWCGQNKLEFLHSLKRAIKHWPKGWFSYMHL